ncbi:DapH/DapD/GlmU-related protein [Oceanobacillus sp. CFH 90083]|uniref:acyltransferase n=1 Tax=Oceanobacillus sp. CFH 90083 TaxID=2592336 RepID=UPI00128BF931|nr:acyltransferase [Oceanobacillus sp. CFH 90083]
MSFKKRLWHTLRLCLIRSGIKRAEYIKQKDVYGGIGDNCMIMPRKVPLYPKLIRIGNNVRIASNVTFVTHDDVHNMLNTKFRDVTFIEKIGCIDIWDNVFVGADTKIMYNVRIGSNVIIASGSVVTKDVPSNTIVAGIPAKPIGTFEDFVQRKRLNNNDYPIEIKPRKQHIKEELVNLMWAQFEKKREQ